MQILEEERKKFLAQLAKEGIARPVTRDQNAKNLIFNNKKASKAVLVFLNTTRIGLRPDSEEEEQEARIRLDNWGIEELEATEGIG